MGEDERGLTGRVRIQNRLLKGLHHRSMVSIGTLWLSRLGHPRRMLGNIAETRDKLGAR